MKTNFKRDVNGLYLEFFNENEKEKHLLSQIFRDPNIHKRWKIKIDYSESSGKPVITMQGVKYLNKSFIKETLERASLSSVMEVKPYFFLRLNRHMYCIFNKRGSSGARRLGTVKLYQLFGFNVDNFTVGYLKAINLNFSSYDQNGRTWRNRDNGDSGQCQLLGKCQTQLEFLQLLKTKLNVGYF